LEPSWQRKNVKDTDANESFCYAVVGVAPRSGSLLVYPISAEHPDRQRRRWRMDCPRLVYYHNGWDRSNRIDSFCEMGVGLARGREKLAEFGLVRVRHENNPGHGIVQIVEPIAHKLVMRADI
jgi:hypothetical protein